MYELAEKAAAEDVDHGGNSNSDPKKKKGRPRRDLHVRAIAIVQEFMAADLEHRGFFGDKFKGKRELLRQVLKLLVAEQETVDEMEVHDLLVADVKSIRIVMTLMTAARGLGIQTKEFAKVFDHQKHFASLTPTVEFPAPKALERLRHTMML